MKKTKFYTPAMYIRNFSGNPVVRVDTFLDVIDDLPGCDAVELLVDEDYFDEYSDRIEEIYDATVNKGIDVPIVRISAPSLFLANSKDAKSPLTDFLSKMLAFFGTDTLIQLETLSAWQVYEYRNDTVLDPDKIPVGYKYNVYSGYVIKAILDFCKICTDLDLTPVIEPRVGHVFSNPESVLSIVDKNGNLPFKIVFDVTHMEFQGINTTDAWQSLQGYVVAVHISDTDVVSNHHLPIGEGTVPWRTILKYAAQSEDVAYLAIELLGNESEDPEVIKAGYLDGLKRVKAMISKYKLTSSFE